MKISIVEKKCMIYQVDCTAKTHTIKVNLFEQDSYLHKGNKKKKNSVRQKECNSKNVCGCTIEEA